jgi:hypothetical protein
LQQVYSQRLALQHLHAHKEQHRRVVQVQIIKVVSASQSMNVTKHDQVMKQDKTAKHDPAMKQDKMVKHDSMKANEMANKSHKDAHAPSPNTPKAQPDTHKVAKTS